MASGLVLLQRIDSGEVRSAGWTPDEQATTVNEQQVTIQVLQDGEMFVAFVTVKLAVPVRITVMLRDLLTIYALIAAGEAVVFRFLVQAPVSHQISTVLDRRTAALEATDEIVSTSSIDLRRRWPHDRGLLFLFEHHFDLLLNFHIRLLCFVFSLMNLI